MSQENVEIIRRIETAFNERDVGAVLAEVHPDVEIELIGGFADIMGQSSFSGAQGARLFFIDWYATFKTVYAEQEQLLDVGADRALVLSKFRATVEGSETPVELPIGSISTFKDGKIIRVAANYDRTEAIEAAGPSE
jgi:ketosteroid isomerase-like protein